ncbi:hypothetical protein GBAR_LOCUS21743 [Geodia barretti]|uniref:Uncharacterized protein n=1 Tax=Geodia barretti TaxID=519541 RepID=A0AA35T2D7_GEOBA|nr:hypothetical protein GBAR_LOCUS21743 [Geodia barretti]
MKHDTTFWTSDTDHFSLSPPSHLTHTLSLSVSTEPCPASSTPARCGSWGLGQSQTEHNAKRRFLQPHPASPVHQDRGPAQPTPCPRQLTLPLIHNSAKISCLVHSCINVKSGLTVVGSPRP